MAKRRYTSLKEIRSEAEKIVFPSETELKNDILIVLGICTVCSLFLWGISTGTLAILKYALGV